MYVPVVTLSKENDTKLLGQLEIRFKRTIKWKIYRSEITIQPYNSNLDYLIYLIFTTLIDYLFCRLRELMQVIKETHLHIIMYRISE